MFYLFCSVVFFVLLMLTETGKVSGQFSLFLHKNINYGHLLESPGWGDSNEYPQPLFLWRNIENYPSSIIKWAASCQNQQNDCVPSEDSD